MGDNCLFCGIAVGSVASKKIWESNTHLAVLTPFPNTPGFSVLLPKMHLRSDILQLPMEDMFPLMLAAQEVAAILRERLSVVRVGLIFEGYGIDHAHVKLVPMHGIPSQGWKQIASPESARVFYEKYPGFIASHDGPQMDRAQLEILHGQITMTDFTA